TLLYFFVKGRRKSCATDSIHPACCQRIVTKVRQVVSLPIQFKFFASLDIRPCLLSRFFGHCLIRENAILQGPFDFAWLAKLRRRLSFGLSQDRVIIALPHGAQQ